MYRMSCSIDRNWIGIDWIEEAGSMHAFIQEAKWKSNGKLRNAEITATWTYSPTSTGCLITSAAATKLSTQIERTISGRILSASSSLWAWWSLLVAFLIVPRHYEPPNVRVHLSIKQQNEIIKEVLLILNRKASVSSLLVFPNNEMPRFYLNNFWIQFV